MDPTFIVLASAVLLGATATLGTFLIDRLDRPRKRKL